MKTVLTIDNEKLTADDLITYLRFSNEFEDIAEKIIQDKLLAQAAKTHNMEPDAAELQQVADDFRRFTGMHRAKDTQEWLEAMKVSVDDFEAFLTGMVMKNKMLSELTTDTKLEDYFSQHSPDFDTADIKHILLDDEAKANEIKALLEEDPALFDELVIEHSIDEDTKYLQGRIMHIRRGTLAAELEAKIFNAAEGDIIGPIELSENGLWEIISVTAVTPATLNEEIKDEVGKAIRDQWFAEKLKNSTISFG